MHTCFRIRQALLIGAGALALAATVALAPQSTQHTKSSGGARPDNAKVAATIVNTSAGIRPNELVLIVGGTRDQELLEDIAVEVRKLGAFPLITIESERLIRRMYDDVPAKFDSQEPAFFAKLAPMVDAVIDVEFVERPDFLASVDPKRIAARAEAEEKIHKAMLDRGVVHAHLGNGLYPTKARAQQYNISQDELTRIFWNGVNVDFDQMQQTGNTVRTILASGKTVRITAPNGTDLTFDIARRPVFVSDGVVSEEDRYQPGPSCQVWLPAGEVYVTPVPNSANGTFVADNFFYEGKHIEGLTLTFKDGKLTEFTAKGDISKLRERCSAAPAGRDVFAALDIGINPNVQTPPNSRFVSWMSAGTISIGAGNNVWAGGENTVSFDLFAHLPNGTLTIDGKPLIEKGKLITN